MKNDQWSLIIDTSLSVGVVLLIKNDEFADGAYLEPMQQEEKLAEHVARFKVIAEQQGGGITKIILGNGPGSFTGLRITHAFIKGFIAETSCTVVLLSSLCGYGHAAYGEGIRSGCFCFDARRDEFFVQAIRNNKLTPVSIMTRVELEAQKGHVLITESIVRDLPLKKIASSFCHIAEVFGRTVTPTTFMIMEPDYGRGAAAKTKAERKC